MAASSHQAFDPIFVTGYDEYKCHGCLQTFERKTTRCTSCDFRYCSLACKHASYELHAHQCSHTFCKGICRNCTDHFPRFLKTATVAWWLAIVLNRVSVSTGPVTASFARLPSVDASSTHGCSVVSMRCANDRRQGESVDSIPFLAQSMVQQGLSSNDA